VVEPATVNSQISFLTFGAGTQEWISTAQRLGGSAVRSRQFATVEVSSWETLQRDHPKFCERYAAMLQSDVKGFGYWIWKPLLIRSALANSKGFLLYLDGGSMLNLRNAAANVRLLQYVERAKATGAVMMELEHPEWKWNKADSVERLGLTPEHVSSPQIMAGVLLLRRSSEIVDLIDAWLEIVLESSHRFVDDSPSRLPERPGFCEHRHDQAILSGLAKLAGINPIPDETYFGSDWLRLGSDYPIWKTRFRGTSDLRLRLRLARQASNPTMGEMIRWFVRN
jgi:hypothetical protein